MPQTRQEAPRYTVRAISEGRHPRQVFESDTEEAESLASWAAREFPRARIYICDAYAGTAEVFRDWVTDDDPLVGGEKDLRRFTLDGEPVDIIEFIEDNAFAMPDLEQINSLKAGESIVYGGGAFATFLLTRVA